MKKQAILIISLIAAFVLISGCINQNNPSNKINNSINSTANNSANITPSGLLMMDDSQATEEGVNSIINSNNEFAIDFYKEVKSNEGNVFFSPYSLSSTFSMAYEGAEGKTADEIQTVFHFTKNDTIRRSSFARIYNILNRKNKNYSLNTANAFWGQKGYSFLEEYKKVVNNYYGAEMKNLDFMQNPEEARQEINKWVEDKTNKKIKDLLANGTIKPDTTLVLTNTLYFKAAWEHPFDNKSTLETLFNTSTHNSIKVQMMKATENIKYMETDKVQMIELPYQQNELSMIIILPKENNISSIEEELTLQKLDEWESKLENTEVAVHLPKFKFKTKYTLNDYLKEMGMPTAFTPSADFSKIDGGGLSISKAIHQTFIEVNEEGTEAAAATAIVFTKSSVPTKQKEFNANHPFLFIIQEHKTGQILFMGRMENPTAAS